MKIIFCDSVIDSKTVDQDYEEEWIMAKLTGLSVSLISYEALIAGNVRKALRYVSTSQKEELAVYRGWMLSPPVYKQLYDQLLIKNIRLVNDPVAYQHCHYLPESYPLIQAYTPRTVWKAVDKDFELPSIHALLKPFGNRPIIVKDYVKSEKHSWKKACFIPKASDREAVEEVVGQFIKLRGDELNVGLVFRQFEKLSFLTNHSQSGMPLTKEFRLIFAFGKLMAVLDYWEEGDYEGTYPDVKDFLPIAKTIQSNFFTMDIAQKQDGSWIIMELGDGQVAGLPVDADISGFYRELKEEAG